MDRATGKHLASILKVGCFWHVRRNVEWFDCFLAREYKCGIAFFPTWGSVEQENPDQIILECLV